MNLIRNIKNYVSNTYVSNCSISFENEEKLYETKNITSEQQIFEVLESDFLIKLATSDIICNIEISLSNDENIKKNILERLKLLSGLFIDLVQTKEMLQDIGYRMMINSGMYQLVVKIYPCVRIIFSKLKWYEFTGFETFYQNNKIHTLIHHCLIDRNFHINSIWCDFDTFMKLNLVWKKDLEPCIKFNTFQGGDLIIKHLREKLITIDQIQTKIIEHNIHTIYIDELCEEVKYFTVKNLYIKCYRFNQNIKNIEINSLVKHILIDITDYFYRLEDDQINQIINTFSNIKITLICSMNEHNFNTIFNINRINEVLLLNNANHGPNKIIKIEQNDKSIELTISDALVQLCKRNKYFPTYDIIKQYPRIRKYASLCNMCYGYKHSIIPIDIKNPV